MRKSLWIIRRTRELFVSITSCGLVVTSTGLIMAQGVHTGSSSFQISPIAGEVKRQFGPAVALPGLTAASTHVDPLSAGLSSTEFLTTGLDHETGTDSTATDLSNYEFVPGDAGKLVKDGKWLRDAEGRYVLLRGVNFGARTKLSPYIPVMPLQVKTLNKKQLELELEAVEPQLCQLHAMGMNIVRLPIMWKALEPTPNPDLDQLMPEAVRYLQHVKVIIDKLYSEGIFVIVDFHQDIAGESYGGDGFPDWALNNDSQHSRFSFFGRLLDSHWGTNYYDVPWLSRMVCHCAGHRLQVRNTLESFWMDKLYNKDPKSPSTQMAQNPQTHFIGTVGQTVRFLASGNGEQRDPAILGYEPFNEPDEVGIDKQNFEQQFLPRFYHKVEAEIGKYDGEALVFIEPRVDWTVYSANGPEYQGLHFTLKPRTFLPAPYSPTAVNGVFSFHYYDPAMVAGIPFKRNMNRKAKEWPEIFRQMSDAADASGLVPFLTEFGCSQDWTSFTSLRPALYNHSVVRACMDLQFQQVEANLLNATYWNYDLYNRKKYNDNWRRENFSLLGPRRTPRNLDIVARPYPMRSSAKPERVFFDAESKNAAIILAGTVADAPTVIYVPRSMHYSGNEFEVRATTSAASVVWDEKNQLLYWLPDKTLTENQIIISRSGGFDQKVLPAESLRLLPRTQYLMVVERDKKAPVACAASRPPAS